MHLIYTNISYCSLPPTHTVLLGMLYAFYFTGKHDWWARHQERERMICKTKTSWSLSSRKTNLFIGVLKDTNGDTVREKETGKWSDLSSQLLAYGEIFPTSARFQRKRQKKSELWEYAWVLLVKMRIPGQEIFFGGLSFWFCLWFEYTP